MLGAAKFWSTSFNGNPRGLNHSFAILPSPAALTKKMQYVVGSMNQGSRILHDSIWLIDTSGGHRCVLFLDQTVNVVLCPVFVVGHFENTGHAQQRLLGLSVAHHLDTTEKWKY